MSAALERLRVMSRERPSSSVPALKQWADEWNQTVEQLTRPSQVRAASALLRYAFPELEIQGGPQA